jgi:Family of unknown function (DUF5343)
MVLQQHGPGAYAPPKAIVGALERWRDRGLPVPVTADTLLRAGVTTESLAPRTLQSLKLLGFLTDDGQPTDEFRELQKVASDQYKERLASLLRVVYADVLAHADPAQDDLERITDQFRVYEPASLRDRMVTLFIGLAEYAGIISEVRAREVTGRRGAGRAKATAARTSSGRSTPPKPQSQSSGNGAGSPAPGLSPPGVRASGGDSRSLTLRSGGTVTLTVSLNVFDLSTDDREFVWGLIDKMRRYEQEASPQPPQGLGSEHPGPHRGVPAGSKPED